MAVDEARVEEMVGQLAGHMTGGALCLAIWLGDELGYYRTMANGGPLTADDVAAKSSCNPRLTREWLDGQASAGIVSYDPEQDAYVLSDEAAMILADETSPAFMARGMNTLIAMVIDGDKLRDAYRGDGGLSWHDHHECLFRGTEWFFRPGYRAFLTSSWIPALDGVEQRLQAGAASPTSAAGTAPQLWSWPTRARSRRFTGSTSTLRRSRHPKPRERGGRRGPHGVFPPVAGAKDYPGTYDLICFFDCLHDMGDPVGIARYARDHLAPGGTVLLVEPMALDGRATNISRRIHSPRCSTRRRPRSALYRTRSPKRSGSV